jgi:arsenate reductase (thioredoxin)
MQQVTQFAWLITLLLLVHATAAQVSDDLSSPINTVVFVCEHGSVKSVMAAAILDQLAQRRGMAIRGLPRGVHPDEAVPRKIVDALRLEGEDVANFRPRRADQEEVRAAARVIAIGVEPRSIPVAGSRLEVWDDIPDSRDYSAAHAGLVRRIEALLDELQVASVEDRERR